MLYFSSTGGSNADESTSAHALKFLDDLTTRRQRSAIGLTCMTTTSSIVELQQLLRGVPTPAQS